MIIDSVSARMFLALEVAILIIIIIALPISMLTYTRVGHPIPIPCVYARG